jgi:hypothetical protein
MRTHRLRVVPVRKAAPIPDFPADNTSAGSAHSHTAGADRESRELEQLCKSLANVSANDRHALLRYFGRMARYIAAVKFDSAESE